MPFQHLFPKNDAFSDDETFQKIILTLSQIILIFENEDWKKTTCYLLHRGKKEQDICSDGVADGGGQAGSKYDEGAMNIAFFQSFFYPPLVIYEWKFGVVALYRKSFLSLAQKWNCEVSFPIPTFMFLLNLYIPMIGLPISLQQNRQTDPGNI